MATVSIPTTVALRATELMVLFSKKGAFFIEEFVDAGTAFKHLRDLAQSKDATVDADEIHVKYVLSTISVCSSRVAVEAQNYRVISDLAADLTKALKAEVEETKTEL